MRKMHALWFVVLLGAAALGPTACGATQAGCAKVNITPPVGVWLSGYGARDKPSDDVVDDLYARALVVGDGNDTVAIVSLDLLWTPLQITNEVRGIIRQKTGIAGHNVLVCATHTHFGPKIYNKTNLGPEVPDNTVDDSYVRTLVKKTADSVFLAHKNMREVSLGVARGELAEVVYHRRRKADDGSVSMAFSLPDEILATRKIVRDSDGTVRVTFAYPEDQPQWTFGPIDPDVWVLKVRDADGDLVGSVVNFACHAVSGSAHADWFYSISGDYPGHTSRVVERTEGGVCLFTSGTAGDIVPLKRGREPRYQIGTALAGEVIKKLQFAETLDDVKVRGYKAQIEIPLKETLAENRIIDANETQKTIVTETQVVRIGDVYVLGLPGEVLVEVGLEIRKRAPVERLIIVSVANDSVGYVCHAQAYEEGGYESTSGTNLAQGAGEIVIGHALELIRHAKQGDAPTATR